MNTEPSFSSRAKAELCTQRFEHKFCAVAEAYGILLYCNSFTPEEIRIITSNDDFVLRLPKLFRKAFCIEFDRKPENEAQSKRSFVINDPQKLAQVFSAFGLEVSQTLSHHINLSVLDDNGCRAAFMRGAFLAGGSVTDPEKRYHLEFTTPHHSVSREAYSLLLEMGFAPKESCRAGNSLVYFKQADAISDLLTTMGASASAMEVITAKVDKEMRNTITRQINCDSANTDKVVAAAQEQMNAIRRYAKAYGLDTLPDALKDAALLRITNPEASLADLATLSSPPVSKSCLSHRMKKIISLAPKD